MALEIPKPHTYSLEGEMKMDGVRKIPLRELTIVIDTGLTQRYSRSIDSEGKAPERRIIKAKDIENGQIVDLETLDWVQGQYAKTLGSRELAIGDILVATKGTSIKAAKVGISHEGCVFADTLTRMRLKNNIMPDYVIFAFSLPQITRELIPKATGINTTFISKRELASFVIPVPGLEVQKKIVKLYAILQKERELTEKLLELKERLVIDGIMQKITTENNTDDESQA